EDGIRFDLVTGVQTCALPIYSIAVGPGKESADASGSLSLPSPQEQLAQALASSLESLPRPGHATFYLHLDPPGLGSVRVHLSARDRKSVASGTDVCLGRCGGR